MHQHAKSMGLEGWAVWHAAHLSRLLDNHPSIRQTYLGLTVTGDFLQALIEANQISNPDAATALTSFVAKELVNKSSIRLTRAGGGPDKEQLSDIGIDLPAVDREIPLDIDGKALHHFIAKNFIERGDQPIKISSGKFCTVLIGGPGQGKSTIGQLICQAYRIAILEDRLEDLTPEQKGVWHATTDHLATINLPLPAMLRWPIYIQLAEYSEKILGSEDYSLLKFIAAEVNKNVPFSLTQSDIYGWLRQWPWVVVLDGYDEVPDTYTRTTLLQKISDFVSDAAMQNADVSILATTRRQGYDDDLRNLEPKEYELVELNNPQALSYGRQLVGSRHPNDSSFASIIYERLVSAAEEPMTAKLMGSPLQVSIMASLLEDRVRLPRTRHALFTDFYETVFKREANKVGIIGARVEQHKANIGTLHDAAGVLLHHENEKAGKADVHLSRNDLISIATEQLLAQTYDPVSAASAAEKLIGLAAIRFIMLVESATDSWGFEVRSFQEFMASRFIVNGPEDQIIARLRCLIRSSHWRNTWLFAAAQVFETRIHLRGDLLALVAEADSQSMADHLAKPGSILAGDLLLDNFATSTPGLRQQLLKQAIQTLGRPELRLSVLDIFHDASEQDTVISRLIKERFSEAIKGGGALKAAMEPVIAVWLKRYTGSVSSYLRTQIHSSSRSLNTPGLAVKLKQRDVDMVSKGAMLHKQKFSSLITWEVLTAEESATLKDFLDEFTLDSIRTNRGGEKYRPLHSSHTTANVAKSDTICTILAEAFDKLPEEDALIYDWIIGQITQSLGEAFVGDALSSITPLPQRSSVSS